MQVYVVCLSVFMLLRKKLYQFQVYPKKTNRERERESESGGRQIEGEHTQFKRGRSMQEKQLVCSLSSVTFNKLL